MKEINIAICDDEEIEVKLFLKYVNNWAFKRNKKTNIDEFYSAESFYSNWLDKKNYDILLLDIEMPGKNGVDLAKKLRENDEDISIIFITGVFEFIGEGYEVEAINYLLKPINEEKLHTCLDKAVEKIAVEKSKILLETQGETISLNEEDIIFIESFSHDIIIRTIDEEYTLRMNLSDIEKKLDKDMFIRNHRSYIVNFLHIKKIQREEIELDNESKIPLSRRRYKKVNMKFIKFFRGGLDEC